MRKPRQAALRWQDQKAEKPVFYDISRIVIEKDTRPKMTNLTTLPAAEKQRAWAKIKRLHPALAELLKSDEVAEICKMFSAQVMVEKAVLA